MDNKAKERETCSDMNYFRGCRIYEYGKSLAA
jgi:hypothetical protein